MKTTEQGRLAEAAVVKHLQKQGFNIIAQNWRRPRAEIDVIVQKGKVVFFVEVKYRAQFAQGEGFEYITPKKLKQMDFAARLWIAEMGWNGDWRLVAASVSGLSAERIELVEI